MHARTGIVGVDEAGRGPLCGPVVTCAFYFKKKDRIKVKDSKKLSFLERQNLFYSLTEKGIFSLNIATPSEIDKYNILKATILSFNRSIKDIIRKASFLKNVTFIIDGNAFKTDLGVKYKCITGGANVRFEGTEGWVFVKRGFIDAYPKSLLQLKLKPDDIKLYESNDHMKNFLDCIKSRRKPVADFETGHRSATLCHLGNIAMRLGRRLYWDSKSERFVNDQRANRMLSVPMRSPWQI